MLNRLLAALPAALLLAVPAAAQAAPQSSIRAVEITRTEPAGTFGGVAFRRIQGVIHGEVAASEAVAGLREVAAGRELVPYDTGFDMVLPEDPSRADGVIVEANNRGMPVLLGMMSAPGAIAPPKASASGELKMEAATSIRDGLLFAQRLSLAHVQWQTGISPGVPQAAQGIGEVIVRDFGRLLGGGFPAARTGLPVFRHRILAGVSQSAWLVNSVIAEGFNVDPQTGRGVYQGVFTRDGAGVVMAINRFAAGKAQSPYVATDMTPLTPAELLSRPKSDPVVVDVTAFTDFYRVRASVFARAAGTPRLHRYATAAAHAPGTLVPQAFIFGKMQCNGGVPVPMNPTNDTLYLRPLLLGLANAVGIATATPQVLPPDAPLELTPAPPGLKDINRLGATPLWVPKIAANGAASGGVAMIDAVQPLGVADPPALPPVGTASINDTCGNFSGWKPLSDDELKQRYGSRAAYLSGARRQAARLVKTGYLLGQDEAAAVAQVEALLPAGFQ